MRAGELRSSVIVERSSGDADGQGGLEALAWSLVFRGPCAVDEQWVRERIVAAGLVATGGSVLRLRYRPDITEAMRARVTAGPGVGVYNITGVLVVNARGTGRPEALLLACERNVAV